MTEREKRKRDTNLTFISHECADALTWTFTNEELERLQSGAIIKVRFLTDEDRNITESIWMQLVEKNGSIWRGILCNHPFGLAAEFGDEVEFRADQIIDVDTDTYFAQLK